MRSILGVCRHSAYQIREYIEEWKSTLPEEKAEKLVGQFLGFGHVVKQDVMIILVPTLQCVLDAFEDIDNSDAVVIVFDSPIILAQARIKLLDTITSDQVRWTFTDLSKETFIQELRDALNGNNSVSVETNFSLVPNLLNSVQGSLTQMLLNLTMRCRVPEKRREITTAYVAWLLSTAPLQKLADRLTSYGLDEQTIHLVAQWFQSEHGAQAKKICITIAEKIKDKKPINYDKLCAGTTIQPFDLKFLLRQARTLRVANIHQTSVELFEERKKTNAGSINQEAQDIMAKQDELYLQEVELGIDSGNGELDFSQLEQISY